MCSVLAESVLFAKRLRLLATKPDRLAGRAETSRLVLGRTLRSKNIPTRVNTGGPSKLMLDGRIVASTAPLSRFHSQFHVINSHDNVISRVDGQTC